MKKIKVYTADYKKLSVYELRKRVELIFNKKFKGKTALNIDKNITILFGNPRKLALGGAMYSKKATVVEVLDKVIRNGKFLNFGKPKLKDKKQIVGFLNFKTKVYIDDLPHFVRFNVRIATNGKFYYSHEIIIKKE